MLNDPFQDWDHFKHRFVNRFTKRMEATSWNESQEANIEGDELTVSRITDLAPSSPQNEPRFDPSKYPELEAYFAAYERFLKVQRDWQKQKQQEKTRVEESLEEHKSEVGNLTEANAGESEERIEKSTNVFTTGVQAEITKESSTGSGAWSTQWVESQNKTKAQVFSIKWKFYNVTARPDTCFDNYQAIIPLHSTKYFAHREMHCSEEVSSCLVSEARNKKRPIKWPKSRETSWYSNITYTKLTEVKEWINMSDEYLPIPGGGTQSKNSALHYIDFLQESDPDIDWGNRTSVIWDVTCGVGSLREFLFDRDVLALSVATQDEQKEAHMQCVLERGKEQFQLLKPVLASKGRKGGTERFTIRKGAAILIRYNEDHDYANALGLVLLALFSHTYERAKRKWHHYETKVDAEARKQWLIAWFGSPRHGCGVDGKLEGKLCVADGGIDKHKSIHKKKKLEANNVAQLSQV